MKKLRPPFKIHGGKWYLCDWIIRQFPADYESRTYIEPFGGAGSVLLNKKRSKKEIYNDLHMPTANIFLSLAWYPEKISKEINNIQYDEVSFKKSMEDAFQFGEVSSAVSELVLRRMSRGGMKKNFSWSTRLRGGRPGDLNAWETFKDQLPVICDRLRNVEVYSKNALNLISEHLNNPSLLLYLDPPYVLSARTAKKVYDCEMSDDEHRKLADLAHAATGKVVISGYDCPLYNQIYKDWRHVTREVPNNSGQGKKKQRRIETLWLNY